MSAGDGTLRHMSGSDPKADLQDYLQEARDVLVWKLEGLSEYEVRRPLTPTGTNLLGLVKHVASVELGYFGETFGRPSGEPLLWLADDAEPNADMWATSDESREEIIAFYHRSWEHADATIAALALDAIGSVPWWPPGNGLGCSRHAWIPWPGWTTRTTKSWWWTMIRSPARSPRS